MADLMLAAFPFGNAVPISPAGAIGMAMIEILVLAQMLRRPAQALARRWYCRSLFRASRGRLHCGECTGS